MWECQSGQSIRKLLAYSHKEVFGHSHCVPSRVKVYIFASQPQFALKIQSFFFFLDLSLVPGRVIDPYAQQI